MIGKLIVIEGTDCSGKETQTKMLVEKLNEAKIKAQRLSFPMYDTPTGKIIGGPYLGKESICEGWFPETAPLVDPKVASLYYAIDRLYNISKITSLLANGTNVILDRYVESNMAHQAGKMNDKKDRLEMYNWLEQLEFNLLKLPRPDLVIFLYMPYDYALRLREKREEKADQLEQSKEHLKMAEIAYLEIAKLYNFMKVDCVKNNEIRSRKNINDEVCKIVRKILKK